MKQFSSRGELYIGHRYLVRSRLYFRETNLTLTTSEASFPFHNLSYEVLQGTIEFVMFELGCMPILAVNGAILKFDVLQNYNGLRYVLVPQRLQIAYI